MNLSRFHSSTEYLIAWSWKPFEQFLGSVIRLTNE